MRLMKLKFKLMFQNIANLFHNHYFNRRFRNRILQGQKLSVLNKETADTKIRAKVHTEISYLVNI